MFPKALGSIVALFVVALCFAACYGQQQIRVCENGVCRIVQLPQAKVDPPFEVPYQEVPAAPSEVYYEASSAPRTNTTRQGLFKRLGSRLRELCCRR